jgi:hydrogenase maturation protease
MTNARQVVIGVGNTYRGDDGVGLAVVERLRTRVPNGVELIACEQEPTRLLDAWQGFEAAIVIDAVISGSEPGALHRYEASDEAVPDRVFHSSTHAFGVGETIELARTLRKLPKRLIVYGIEGQTFESSDELSAPVAAAIGRAVDAVLADVELLTEKEDPCTSER